MTLPARFNTEIQTQRYAGVISVASSIRRSDKCHYILQKVVVVMNVPAEQRRGSRQ